MFANSLVLTRALSLRAPIGNDEERAHFQRRLALASLVIFVLAGSFWLVTTLSVAFVAPQRVGQMLTAPVAQVQLATTSIALVCWAFTRKTARGIGTLEVADIVSGLAICLGWSLMTEVSSARTRPDLISLLACTFTLVMRSALIPSTPARSAVLSGVALVPLIWFTHRQLGGEPTSSPLSPAVYAAIWALLAVGATTTTTAVTYGLRLQVKKAMQLGQYFLDEKIGEGGMGAVYRASHALLRRPTAIKLLSDGSEHAIERFEREVQMTARLTHPNTIAVFDYGRTPDGVFYYAMEYLEGVSLQDLVDRTGAQPPARVVHVLLQICGALREAHTAGLVHRDIKPANVMLTSRGDIPDFVKVLDFGLVKETVDMSKAGVTHTNAILGTPYYMAPESILEPQSVDRRADIYALGATAFFMLTGGHLFDGNSVVEVCSKHIHEAPSAPSSKRADIPASLDAIVLACLAKRPDNRPQDAAKLMEDLRSCGLVAWSDADALAWWTEHADTSRSSRAAAAEMLSTTMTVAMDVRLPKGGVRSARRR